MRVTTLLRRVLGVTEMFVRSVEFEGSDLVVGVAPRWQRPRCGACGGLAPGYDLRGARRWRHLGLGELRIWLSYAPRRVDCRKCGGIRTEQVPWAEHGSRFTRAFEELTAYLAQSTDHTSVTRQMGISWRTVGAIVGRVVARELDPTRLEGIRNIGIDEFGYRKRHRYLTTIVDHDRRRVIWAAPGRSAATLEAFFDKLGPRRCDQIECVTIDMAVAYITAVERRLPHAQIVFDRFHVQRLASRALEKVRRALWREAEGKAERRTLFRSRYAMLKNPWNLNRHEQDKLRDLQRTNAPLYRAYLLKEALAEALEYRQPARAERALRQWLSWASRSRLKPFVIAARTIRKHLRGVLAYISGRLTNGIVEGFNNKLRMIARRAFGFHSPQPLISMLYLCCGGITLSPPLPEPT